MPSILKSPTQTSTMARSDDSCAPRASRTDAADAVARPSRRLVLALLTFVLLFGAVGYARLGNRAGLQVEPRVVAASALAVRAAHSNTIDGCTIVHSSGSVARYSSAACLLAK